jgi:hypothetical protein
MENLKNYYVYADAIQARDNIKIYVPSITMKNIDDHIDGIYAILKDGIETDYIHNLLINISWGDNLECDLYIIDYWFNLFMWKMILKNGDNIEPKHIFYTKELKVWNIKEFVDKFVLTRDKKIKLGNKFLNNNICDGLWAYSYIEAFSYYLANTINNEDTIDLMNVSTEFYDLMHCSLKDVPFDQVKDAGMEYTNKSIDIIKNSKKYIGYDHGLAASFKASEAVNPRQFKEAVLNIGTKPNGTGGIYPYVIDKNFSNGGVNDPLSYFIESSSARTAQIMSKTNVGDSGDFARLLGLNNTDTILNSNMNYECMSQNFIEFEIKSKKHLSMIKNRYYRFNPRGIENLIDDTDYSLIGKKIYMRSPMTCACNSSGKGICKKCYGDLYYTNLDINVGKIAAEILSAQLTQTLLSAKHLLETKIQVIKWNPEFDEWFDIDINSIKLTDLDELNLKKYNLVIDPENIFLVNEETDAISFEDENGDTVIDDTGVYNEYITYFYIKTPDGNMIKFGSDNQDSLYISQELNNIIRKKAVPDSGLVNIPLSALQDNILFYIKITNNEISKTMNDIINVINKSSVTENLTKDQALQSIVDLIIDGNLHIDSVHLEVILSNQIVDPKDILKKPNWNSPNAQYRMFTLNQALTNNPSVIISLLYKDLHRVLYNPLTFRKNAPSFFDLFFNEQPQNYMSNKLLDSNPTIINPEKGIEMVKIVEDK